MVDETLHRRSPAPQLLGIDVFSILLGNKPVNPTQPGTPPINVPGPVPVPTDPLPLTESTTLVGVRPSDTRRPPGNADPSPGSSGTPTVPAANGATLNPASIPTPIISTAPNGVVVTSTPSSGSSTAFVAALGSNSTSSGLNPNASSTPSVEGNAPTARPTYPGLPSGGPGTGTGTGPVTAFGTPGPTGTPSVDDEAGRNLNVAALVGGLIGGLICIASLIFILIIYNNRRRRRRAIAGMDDATSLLIASKQQETTLLGRNPQDLSAAESQTRPISFGTQYGLDFNPRSANSSVLVIGRPSASRSHQAEPLTPTSLYSTVQLHAPGLESSRVSSTVNLTRGAETDIAEIGSSMDRSLMPVVPVVPVLPEIETQTRMGLSFESPAIPASENPFLGPDESVESSPDDSESFYSSITPATTKYTTSLHSQDFFQDSWSSEL